MLNGKWPAAHRESATGPGPTGHGRETPEPQLGLDGSVVELPLLLTGGEATALESAAHARGMTVAQLLRRLIKEFHAGPTAEAARGENTEGEGP
jgi:hypothetical protein